MNGGPRTKRVKTTNENPGASSKPPILDVFINQLDNYPANSLPAYVQPIESLFAPVSSNGLQGELQSALILTFLYSQEILDPLLAKDVRLLVVSDSQRETLATTLETNPSQPNLKLVFPRRSFNQNAPASFHPKLFVLKFKTFLRIVIGSGNLLNGDWHRYANVFWRKDFAYLGPPQRAEDRQPSPLAAYLQTYIQRCLDPFGAEMETFLGIRFRNYQIEDALVHPVASLPGLFEPSPDFNVSFFQGQRILREAKPQKPFTLQSTKIYYITSSLGSLNFKLLYDFSKMVFHEPSFNWDFATKHRAELTAMFNVVYPSKNYISGSYFGESRANCLFLKRMIYDSFKFQKSVMRSYEGNLKVKGNNAILPHYKIWVVTHDGKIDSDTIVYIGSHNFTQSAWGRFENKDERIEVCNYELGLILPPKEGTHLLKEVLIDQFGVVLPPPAYAQHDLPFFVLEE